MGLILCHDIWNGSHPHIIVVSLDSVDLKNFYAEIQKKITDIIKRLLGLAHLSLWEGRPNVAKIDTLADAEDRISYLYANPGQDSLEDTIERYPGYSSWRDFQKSFDTLKAQTCESYPRIRLPSIPRLKRADPTNEECRAIARLLRKRNKQRHQLVRNPNAWMKVYGITTDVEVKEVNDRIIEKLRVRELIAREKRIAEGRTVIGARALEAQAIMKPHTPKKHGRKIYIISSDKESRISYIQFMKRFTAECRQCYQRWKGGDFSVEWPPGAFKPPLPPSCNVIPLFA